MTEAKLGRYRWTIAALLLFSTTINYMDRQVVSYLKEYFCTPVEQGGFGWTNIDYGNLISWFTFFYAFVTIISGWVIDKIGTKLGLALSLITWSSFGILNAFVGRTVALNIAVRSLFGIGEAGNFPASIKTVAEWFPKKERALATGIFNSGSNIGAMVASLFVPWCMLYFGPALGWKMAFILTGAIGFIWLIFWFILYDAPSKHKFLTKQEYDYIHSDDVVVHVAPSEDVSLLEDKAKVSWFKLLRYPQTWAFFVGKFMTDGVWWFLLFWLPDYLKKQFGMNTHDVRWPTFIVYGIAILGSVYGGRIPMLFMNRGMEAYKARMRSMLIIAVLPLALLSTQYFGDKARFGDNASLLAIAVICLGAAAHQAWSANLFTTVSDMFPKIAVGSVTGIGGAAGGLGGVLIQQLAGRLTQHYIETPQTAYLIMFCTCALAYVIAWSVMKILVPKFSPISSEELL
ncbi:MFS transporter [Mucilaginibacter paludis]|uniref:Major facilitator superfamily MFS_1 n=1 Tax=Mucilaginibacter paludis DSM 18603 TaxID=714943 RepID=H1XZQ8_9SPHI|nr:MFS transporter [Mucilaginibacter paludis]EHQ27750.1 major facilitator superfamily MFS_1 [Mucilaginibacter paludis DSM 18603]